MPRRWKKLGELLRSAAVGGLATVVDLVLLVLLVEWVGLQPIQANLPALAAGLAVQFFGNKYFAFGDRSRALLRQGSLFILVEAGALLLNAASFHLVMSVTESPYTLARVACSSAVYMAYSFPLWGRIFRSTPLENGA